MKNLILILAIGLFFLGCEKEEYDRIIGKWKYVKGYDMMAGGYYVPNIEDQRIEEYTKNNERIRYDYLDNEISRCSFSSTDSVITIYGVELNGQEWELSYKYWFVNDTLKIRNDGGFEYYDEYFIRIK